MSLPKFSFSSRARPFIEVGTGDVRTDLGVARWDVAHWDNPADATWSGAEPLWVDETCYGYTIELAAGRQRNTDVFAPATATIALDNSDGWADATLLTLRPGRSLRVGVDHATLGRHVLFRGIVDAVAQSYRPGGGDTVEISAVCMLGDVGRSDLAKLGAPVGAGEPADVRVNRILNVVKFPGSKRDVQQSATTCLATDHGRQVADAFNIVAESTGGAIYGDTKGNIVFRDRDWQMFLDTSLPDAAIGNVTTGDVCPSEFHLSHRRDDLVTQVILGREGVDTVPFTYDQASGQGLYGVETFSATDLVCETTTDLNAIATRLFRVRGGYSSTERVERVLVDAARSDDALDLITTASPFDPPSRYRCRLRLGRGVVFNAQMLVTGVRHSMTPTSWTCDIDLDDAAPFESSVARWDSAHWKLSYWAGITTTTEVA